MQPYEERSENGVRRISMRNCHYFQHPSSENGGQKTEIDRDTMILFPYATYLLRNSCERRGWCLSSSKFAILKGFTCVGKCMQRSASGVIHILISLVFLSGSLAIKRWLSSSASNRLYFLKSALGRQALLVLCGVNSNGIESWTATPFTSILLLLVTLSQSLTYFCCNLAQLAADVFHMWKESRVVQHCISSAATRDKSSCTERVGNR